ncbi:low-density lipoprotein receptor-related protein 2-like [Sarcoptes scabiei]|nr:low-density lipoprotein receptor-related protein 2-like [Sarcoptes scabiei]
MNYFSTFFQFKLMIISSYIFLIIFNQFRCNAESLNKQTSFSDEQIRPHSCSLSQTSLSSCSEVSPSLSSSVDKDKKECTCDTEMIKSSDDLHESNQFTKIQQCQVQSRENQANQLIVNPTTIQEFNCEQLNFCDDRQGFEAILHLHRQLDEDANGDIDISESDEFIRDELKYENGAERQKAFHGNDKHITVDELWSAWRVSTVHNWTVDQTVEWLTEVVELPKYQDAFVEYSINGVFLPRLAAQSQIFATLGINNPIHKQKIALKAMDVVLFGVPKPKASNKDFIMGFLFVFATVVGWYAYYQHKYSKDHIRKMMKDIEALANAEKQLESLQMELEKTRQEHEEAHKEKQDLERKLKANEQQQSSMFNCGNDLCHQQSADSDGAGNTSSQRMKELREELHQTKLELKRIEQAYHSRQWIPSRSLQPYLQLTYEIETRYYNAKKNAAELQLQAAREGCDKLKRKRSSLFGAFRMAHSSSIDYVDNTILQARTLLAELTNEMQERIKRWKQIEIYCGFEIVHNPGSLSLERKLYGNQSVTSNSMISNNATTIKTSNSSNSLSKMLRRGSEATLSEEDSLSLISGTSPSTYSSYNNPNLQAVQAIQMWQKHQIPSNLNLKRMSTTSMYSASQSSPTADNYSINGLMINDGSSTVRKPVPKKKLSITSNKSFHLFGDRRGSSDGVEKHFEQLNGNQTSGYNQKENSCSSQSESNIYDYQSRPFLMDDLQSKSNQSTELNNNHSINRQKSSEWDEISSQPTKSNDHSKSRDSILNELLMDKSVSENVNCGNSINDDTFSSTSSNESTTTVNTNINNNTDHHHFNGPKQKKKKKYSDFLDRYFLQKTRKIKDG